MSQYPAYTIDKTILREYDIRGIVGKSLTEKDALYVGLAFGTRLIRDGYKTLGISYDGRHSSPAFAKAIIEGLNACGIDVELYGCGPTPMAYYGQAARNLDACISITGSHNPPDYNGIKMGTRDNPVYGEQILELGLIAASGEFASGNGTLKEVNIYEEYTSRLAADYKLPAGQKPLNIVWDAGNGASGAVLELLTSKIPGTHTILFGEVDGNFPNHHPDPSVEKNLADLRRVVKEKGADVGIAFDGDGDRIGIIDRNGTIIVGDRMTYLYMRDILTRQPGAAAILDVKCSQAIVDLIKKSGGDAIIWKTGHSLAKVKLKETANAAIGGELSGHIFFKEGFYGHDDALYAAIRMLNVIHAFGDLSEQIKILPQTFVTPEIRFHVPEEDKFAIIKLIQAHLKIDETVSVLDIDGVRVSNADGWFLIRASNTENALTIRAEGTSESGFKAVKQRMADELARAGSPVPDELK